MMATFADGEGFLRAHEVLAEAAIEREARRAADLLEAHIASTLTLVYPDTAGRGS